MGTSSEYIVPSRRLSLTSQLGVTKLLMLILLSLALLSTALAAPTASPIDDEALALEARDESSFIPTQAHEIEARSAGLFWGPHYIGNLKLYLTNPHVGYAGPKFPNANHVNFHVDKSAPQGKWTSVVNMHIVKYHSGGSFCLYIWDSVTNKTVFDKCFDNFTKAIAQGAEAVKDFVHDLLKAANWFATIALVVIIVGVVIACLAGLGAVALA